MITLKYFPSEFTESRSKKWLKVKKRLKKQYHTQLRRGKLNKPYSSGWQIEW